MVGTTRTKLPEFPRRTTFPEPAPVLCVTFFSCIGTNVSGTEDLQHTYAFAVQYFEKQRALSEAAAAQISPLRYEFVWVDNGGSEDEHARFLGRGAQFEVARRNPTNEGLFRAVNDAWFRGLGCRAPYVLSLEDDRVPRPDHLFGSIPHLVPAMELLASDPALSGVRLKNEWSDELIAQATAAELGYTPEPRAAPSSPRGLRYLRHCMVLSSGYVWGSFSMAAVVYDRERLRSRVGLLMEGGEYDAMPYDYAEGSYTPRVTHTHTHAHPHTHRGRAVSRSIPARPSSPRRCCTHTSFLLVNAQPVRIECLHHAAPPYVSALLQVSTPCASASPTSAPRVPPLTPHAPR